MNVGDYVVVINPNDEHYGHKFIIRGIATNFDGKITGYTVNGNGGKWRDYHTCDLYYTTEHRRTFTPQMQLL